MEGKKVKTFEWNETVTLQLYSWLTKAASILPTKSINNNYATIYSLEVKP